ncbi:MAG: aquaporin family protein [Melioribacteraceae bacterium]|nr:aquaporin family protein [Melioribacteraceae bacterium]
MSPFIGEIIGTMLMILFGGGVVANVVLKKTKGGNSGWIVITFGWAIGVFVAVFSVGAISGAHLNPAITLGLAFVGKFAWADVPLYILAQFIGAMLGAFLVWLHYRLQFAVTDDKNLKLCIFCTAPEIRSYADNLISEIIGTFVLVFAALYIASPEVGIGAISALPVAFLVLGIGLSLGGTTGYAINPARDLGPRIMHALLPIPNKRDSDWKYAWVPVVGPIIGSTAAAALYLFLN